MEDFPEILTDFRPTVDRRPGNWTMPSFGDSVNNSYKPDLVAEAIRETSEGSSQSAAVLGRDIRFPEPIGRGWWIQDDDSGAPTDGADLRADS